MAKSYRNKPNRDKRNRTRKEKSMEVRNVPQYVWDNIKRMEHQVSSYERFDAFYP